MPFGDLCRLCVSHCQGFKMLFDENGQENDAYLLMVKYFDSAYFKVELAKQLSVICYQCWQHIDDFNTFQQSVLKAQQKLLQSDQTATNVYIKSEPEPQYEMDMANSPINIKIETPVVADTSGEKSLLNINTTYEKSQENLMGKDLNNSPFQQTPNVHKEESEVFSDPKLEIMDVLASSDERDMPNSSIKMEKADVADNDIDRANDIMPVSYSNALAEDDLMSEMDESEDNFSSDEEASTTYSEDEATKSSFREDPTSSKQSFWEIDCQLADEAFFKNNFRMSRSLFYKLCQLLPGMRKNDTKMRETIPLEKRIAIALYALGSSAEYRTIANIFGVGESTVCTILLNFVAEVWTVLAPMYLNSFPLSRGKVEVLVQEFEALGFPQCMGAIDGCHIEIHPSKEDAADYYNNKGWYSTVLLALVDARCRFIYVSCGSPGRFNDSQIFVGSSLKKELDNCHILSELKKNISGVDVPVLIIGDSAFRLSNSLMKPYPFQVSQTFKQQNFNYALSKSRSVVENAFGQLKARFSRIGQDIDNVIRNANAVILSCCALHNFLNENNDMINEKWLQDLELLEAKYSYPEYNVILTDRSTNAEEIRSAIANYLSREVAAAEPEF